MSLPAIVVNAFTRPASLRRLLDGLSRADIPQGVRLHISIDGGGDPDVVRLAEGFAWPHGEKTASVHPENLGLVGHFLHCGGLTSRFGEIVYLEDDLAVSRQAYTYSLQALEAYRDDPQVAGISLNSLPLNGYTRRPFTPLPGSGDAFFAQVYWYQGQVYTSRMWSDFYDWWRQERRPITPADGLHPIFLPGARWENEFFPDAMHYLKSTGRTFAFPYQSHSTQFGDPGTHFAHSTSVYQVPLQHEQTAYRFMSPSSTRAVYDGYLEIHPDRLAQVLGVQDFDVDLNVTKPAVALTRPFVLTTREARESIRSFGLAMRPPELNVLDGVPGDGIRLARTADLQWGRLSVLRTNARLDAYQDPHRPGLLRQILYRLLRPR